MKIRAWHIMLPLWIIPMILFWIFTNWMFVVLWNLIAAVINMTIMANILEWLENKYKTK